MKFPEDGCTAIFQTNSGLLYYFLWESTQYPPPHQDGLDLSKEDMCFLFKIGLLFLDLWRDKWVV